MNKKNNKKGVGVLVLLVAILIVIVGLFNISRLTSFLKQSESLFQHLSEHTIQNQLFQA